MEQKYGIIYRAYDSEGKSYIGQTVKGLDARRKQHESSIVNPKTIFNKVLKEKGIDAFKWEVLEDNIPEEQLLERERYWVQVFDSKNNGYNGKYVTCFPRNKKLSEETRKKISEAMKGRPSSKKGKHLSEETRKKISENHVGMKGKHFSEETRKKISESNKGKLHGMKGQHHSDETKKKISKSLKGRHWKLVDGKRILLDY